MPERTALLAAERSRLDLPLHGSLRVGIGYPGSYHVAHSSLAFQWIVEPLDEPGGSAKP